MKYLLAFAAGAFIRVATYSHWDARGQYEVSAKVYENIVHSKRDIILNQILVRGGDK